MLAQANSQNDLQDMPKPMVQCQESLLESLPILLDRRMFPIPCMYFGFGIIIC